MNCRVGSVLLLLMSFAACTSSTLPTATPTPFLPVSQPTLKPTLTHTPRDSELMVVQAIEGAAWTGPVNLSKSPEVHSTFPLLGMAPDGTVHVVWGEDDNVRPKSLMYSYKSPGGEWATPTEAVSYDVLAERAMLATDGLGGVHLVYMLPSQHGGFIYRRKASGQEHWEEERPLDGSVIEDKAIPLGLAIDSENQVHMLAGSYGNPGILTGIWHVQGAAGSWSVEPISLEGIRPNQAVLAILPNGDLHLILSEHDKFGLGHWARMDGRWEEVTSNVLIDSELTGPKRVHDFRVVESNDNTLHLIAEVWTQTETGSDVDIFYMNFAKGVWSRGELISGDGKNAFDPAIAVDRLGSIHVVWFGSANPAGPLFYQRRSPNGNWSTARQVASGSRLSPPALVVGPHGNLHLAWQYRLVTETPYEMHYATLPVTAAASN